MLNEKFYREIEKGLPASIYFLWSKEAFFLEEALVKIKDKVVGSYQVDFNYDVFYPSVSPQDIVDTAFTLPFLAPRRLIVLKDFHEFSSHNIDALTNYFENPSKTTCMVILSPKPPKSNLNLSHNAYEFNIREYDIPAWVKKFASEKGLKISETAISYLIEAVGINIGLLASEIEKLTLSEIKIIQAQDIISTTGIMREFTSFNLVDALITGQKNKAFRILNNLIEGKSFEPATIVGTLNWHYKQLYSLWKNKGKRPDKMRTASYKILLKHLHNFTKETFYEIFRYLHEADLGIKSSGRPEIVLEILLIKLLTPRRFGTTS